MATALRQAGRRSQTRPALQSEILLRAKRRRLRSPSLQKALQSNDYTITLDRRPGASSDHIFIVDRKPSANGALYTSLGQRPRCNTDQDPRAESPTYRRRLLSPGLIAAIRGAQADTIRYPEFLKQSTAAGPTAYWAFLTGKKVIYFRRKGDFHIEEFPKPTN